MSSLEMRACVETSGRTASRRETETPRAPAGEEAPATRGHDIETASPRMRCDDVGADASRVASGVVDAREGIERVDPARGAMDARPGAVRRVIIGFA